jgi:predicted ATPase/DNA-binding CsgD family transcriptional regulator
VRTEESADRDDPPDTVLGNLPVQITQLVGRAAALEELRGMLWRTRLLTLCGPGGAGKSRLAAALAEGVRADLVGGAWWADLSSSVDPDLVAQAVAAAVLPGEQVNDPHSAIVRRLSSPALLVLDNCEQVAAGCAALVVDLLAGAPALRIIVTSRQPLGIPGEQVWRVPGLTIEAAPAGDRTGRDGGAVALFVARAREAGGAFAPDAPGARAAVTEICECLDGMPLAIELAAARVAVLNVGQIAERLQRDSDLLRHSNLAAPGRHRTLQDTLEWSHQLLTEGEQALFRRLGVFRGNFSLAAAEVVCSDELLPAADVLELLSGLIDQSLVLMVDSPSLPRYRLLGTVRRYALRKLESSLELDVMLERHAAHYHALGPRAHAGLAGSDQLSWFEALELDHDNLSEALEWLFAHSPAQATELASALWPFCYQRGYYAEARSWFERALRCGGELPAASRIDALLKAGEVAFLQCDYPVAIEHLTSALELIGPDGDRRGAAIACQRLGSIAREQGRYEESRSLHEQSMAIWFALGDAEGVAASENYLGFVAWLSGDHEVCEQACSRALAEFRRGGNLRDVAATLVSLGANALYDARYELADARYELAAERLEEALSISRRLGFQEGVAWSLHELAILGRRRRRPTHDAELMLRDALLVHQQLGDRWRMASVIEEIAGSVLARRDPPLAARLMACACSLRSRIGTPVPPAESRDQEAAVARIRRQLNATGFDSAWADGSVMELELAVTEAVAAIDGLDTPTEDAGAGQPTPILTPRELAVLELLSQGQTNREIATALYISPSTAGVHVSNILRKLQAKRRVDAAARAHSLGLLSVR